MEVCKEIPDGKCSFYRVKCDPRKWIILTKWAIFNDSAGFQHTFMGFLKEIDGKIWFIFISQPSWHCWLTPQHHYHSEAKAEHWSEGFNISIVSSFIYIYCHLYVVSHLELSNWTGHPCISFYGKFLSIPLWFYHIVVVVVVVVYYTTTYICCCCCCVVYFYWSFVCISRNKRALFVK